MVETTDFLHGKAYETETKFIAITLPEDYPYCMLITGLLVIECVLIGMIAPKIARSQVYEDQQVENRIEALHEK